ncbi:MAG: hypothetical protein LUI07_06450 [Lachnospiraceae bacterium]|nr:hypothetical protein [Lachnospiraceae bacterium]
MGKKGYLRALFVMLAVAMLTVLASSTAVAASKKKNTWYESSSGNYYYYNQNGKKLKDGKYEIKGKYYYFDSDGIQRTGWQKVDGSYYYFKIAKGKKGYMLTSQDVNGIVLNKNGKAKLTSYSRKKLPILYKANLMMQSITKNSDTKKEKLRKCFNYTLSYLRYASIGSFQWSPNWDLYYATRIFVSGYVTGACYTHAVVFGYLANAVGYRVNVISSGYHGWTEINNLIYDASWSRSDKTHDYFGMPYGVTGAGILLNYASSRNYIITI